MVEIEAKNIEIKGNEKRIIKKVISKVLEIENVKHDVDVFVMLTDNDTIHAINKEQRGIDKATDVLSFPMFEREDIHFLQEDKKDDVPEILGDIVVSIPKVIEQSEEYGHSYERELAYLVTHGMLHLLGYDHIEEDDKRIMREHEENILNLLKIVRE